MAFKSHESALPLTPMAFEVLLALAGRDMHGYAVLQEVSARLAGVLPLRTSSLYRVLGTLLDDGLIEEAAADREERRVYRLTREGRRLLQAEARRLADQVAAARRKRVLPGGRA